MCSSAQLERILNLTTLNEVQFSAKLQQLEDGGIEDDDLQQENLGGRRLFKAERFFNESWS